VHTSRVGLWFAGARGSVATTATLGLLAVRAGLAPSTGLVTHLSDLAEAGLPALDDIVVGGHDTSAMSMVKRAEQLAAGGVVPAALVRTLERDLADVDSQVRQVTEHEWSRQHDCAERISADLNDFRQRHGLDRVVVVNVASTEPRADEEAVLSDLASLEAALQRHGRVLSTSSIYAYAAFRAGCAFVDFTPGTGARPVALRELALASSMPWAGSDGKTGETLLKSVLAPMFAQRALHVRSWAGTNLLGGGDGATLADPAARASKTASKARGLQEMLGRPVDAPVHIDYVDDLGDWKTAWDHVSFEGFLGTRMSLQFTWQGCDSALAAPLVIDLARLVALALERGESGPLPALGFFFKDPVDSAVHALGDQWRQLREWVHGSPEGAGDDQPA
jgi:myo-inositol-1-phosphate synthase